MPAWPCPTLQHPSNQRPCDPATVQTDAAENEQLFKYTPKHHHTAAAAAAAVISSTKQTSGGWPVMLSSAQTGPQGAQLPRTQQCVNSSAQTNSQSSGVADQAEEHVCSSVCVDGEDEKGGKRGRLLGLQQTRSRGPQCPASYSDEGSPVYEPVGSLKLLRCRQCH